MSQSVAQVIAPRVRDLGGFSVRRILPFVSRKMVGPFVFFDHMGPAEFKPGEGIDVRPHPHIGLATVTYLFDGALAHKDTTGADIVIRPGAVNWMTAGRGVAHSERTPPEERAEGHRIHGIQTWVALPKSHEEAEPAFIHHPADTLPVFDLGGGTARLIAGEAWGETSPVEYPWGIWYLAIEAPNGAEFDIPGDAAQERCVYVVDESAKIDGEIVESGSMAVLTENSTVKVVCAPGARLMLAGGDTMDGARFIDWNFVASTKEQIEQAKADWRASAANGWSGTRFAQVPGEAEWIPLPEDQ